MQVASPGRTHLPWCAFEILTATLLFLTTSASLAAAQNIGSSSQLFLLLPGPALDEPARVLGDHPRAARGGDAAGTRGAGGPGRC